MHGGMEVGSVRVEMLLSGRQRLYKKNQNDLAVFIVPPYCQPGLAEISFCYSVILFSSKGFAPAVVLVQGKGWQGEGTDPSWHLVAPVLSMVLLNLNLHGLRCSPEAGGHNYHPLHPHAASQSSQQ